MPGVTMRAALALLTLLLAGCGPNLTAEIVAGHTVLLTNGENKTLTVQRIVANGAGERAECVDTPGTALGPGRSYTTTFLYCDEVTGLSVETDAGTASPTMIEPPR